MGISALRLEIKTKAKVYHSKAPGLSKLPFPAIAIIVGVALVNALIWVAIGIVVVRCYDVFEVQDIRLTFYSTIIGMCNCIRVLREPSLIRRYKRPRSHSHNLILSRVASRNWRWSHCNYWSCHSPASRFGPEACSSGHLFFVGPFHVKLCPSST